MTVMKRIAILLSAIIAFFSCTDFNEEEIPVKFGVNVDELAFSAGSSTQSVTVSSARKWDVTSMPSWVSLKSISHSSISPYEWTATFSASPNKDYDRESAIIIKTNAEIANVKVTQKGEKGRFVAVESVSLSPTELTLTEGENASLTVEIKPYNASIQDVTWKSGNTSIATVSSAGRVDAVAPGSALITVTTQDGNKTATCLVGVKAKVVPVTGVSLDKTSLTLTEGDVQELIATVTPSDATDKSVTWSSSNTSVATVSSTGVVTAKAAGSATITAKTTDGGKTATCSVTVEAKTISVTGVSLNKTSMSLLIGGTERLTATVTPTNATNKNVTWSSSNTGVATVDSNGSVSAVKVGTAVITVKTEDGGKTATCTVTVNPISVTGVSLNHTSLTMTVGDSQTLTATVTPSNATDKSVAWSSSNTSVATVSSSGLVTARSAGTATITVTTNDGGKKATCSVTVQAQTVSVTGVSLNKTSLSMDIGETLTLTATVNPSNATDQSVTWSSSNTSVATVTALGVVSAMSEGAATITVTTNDGSKTATCSVKVVDYQNYEYIDLGLPSGLKWAKYNLGASSPEESGDRYAWGETETKQYYWWGTYKWCNGSEYSLTKYNTNSSYGTVDSRTVLLPADDVAHVKLGGNWRMPTYSEWIELRDYCTWAWTTQNGRAGTLVTGPNGNCIFLPSAGLARYPDGASYVGGYYWSSSLQSLYPNKALCVSFYSNNVSTGGSERCYGESIRPVFEVDKVSVTGVSLNKTNLTMTVGDTETLTATVTPSNATDKSVTWASSNTSVATVSSSGVVTAKAAGTATITVTTNDGGKKATSLVTVNASAVDGSENDHDYVDLGLPSGLKWATCNVGAAKPEDYGDYFAWGETSTKSVFSWTNYKFRTSGDHESDVIFSKYNSNSGYGTVDNKTTLDLSDDAARVNWGGKWRMPTKADFEELKSNCTCIWTIQGGINGYILTSKNNNRSIFLPAGGRWYESSLDDVGVKGSYWTSSLYSAYQYPFYAYFLLFNESYVTSNYHYRCQGRSVRPVLAE